MTRAVYLHGFASSPQSKKAQFFRQRFAQRGLNLEIPQLDQGDFEHLTITAQLGVIDGAVGREPAILIGSSLGGYLAGLYAAHHPNIEKLVLMAPALQFPKRWRDRFSASDLAHWKREGSRKFPHYGFGEERPLGYEFVEDALRYENDVTFGQPALILHGIHDPVVPVEVSRAFANHNGNVTLRLLESGHDLTDVLEQVWSETQMFLGFQNL